MNPATSDAYFNLWAFSILFGDLLYMLASWAFRASFSRRAEPGSALISGTVLGVVIGIILVLVVPSRVFTRPPRPGFSLVIGPALGAAFMVPLGALARWRDPKATYVPTWYAGVGLGLGAAAARLFWIQIYESGV